MQGSWDGEKDLKLKRSTTMEERGLRERERGGRRVNNREKEVGLK
jgi:hypothetical protein